MIARLVTMHFKPDCLAEFLELFNSHSLKISQFPGCRMLNLIQDAQQPNILSTYSLWDSETDLNLYRQSDLFSFIWPITKSFFAESPKAKTFELLFSDPKPQVS